MIRPSADLAIANGVEPQAVIDALVAAETIWIDELLAADEVSAEEANEWRAYRVEDMTNWEYDNWD